MLLFWCNNKKITSPWFLFLVWEHENFEFLVGLNFLDSLFVSYFVCRKGIFETESWMCLRFLFLFSRSSWTLQILPSTMTIMVCMYYWTLVDPFVSRYKLMEKRTRRAFCLNKFTSIFVARRDDDRSWSCVWSLVVFFCLIPGCVSPVGLQPRLEGPGRHANHPGWTFFGVVDYLQV